MNLGIYSKQHWITLGSWGKKEQQKTKKLIYSEFQYILYHLGKSWVNGKNQRTEGSVTCKNYREKIKKILQNKEKSCKSLRKQQQEK